MKKFKFISQLLLSVSMFGLANADIKPITKSPRNVYIVVKGKSAPVEIFFNLAGNKWASKNMKGQNISGTFTSKFSEIPLIDPKDITKNTGETKSSFSLTLNSTSGEIALMSTGRFDKNKINKMLFVNQYEYNDAEKNFKAFMAAYKKADDFEGVAMQSKYNFSADPSPDPFKSLYFGSLSSGGTSSSTKSDTKFWSENFGATSAPLYAIVEF